MLVGTTTVHGYDKERAAQTAARPALPPELMKKCSLLFVLEGWLMWCRIREAIALYIVSPLPRYYRFGDLVGAGRQAGRYTVT